MAEQGAAVEGRQLERMISAAEIAEALGLSRQWVSQQATAGRIPSYKFGRYRRFYLSEVQAWIREHFVGGEQMALDLGTNGEAATA